MEKGKKESMWLGGRRRKEREGKRMGEERRIRLRKVGGVGGREGREEGYMKGKEEREEGRGGCQINDDEGKDKC